MHRPRRLVLLALAFAAVAAAACSGGGGAGGDDDDDDGDDDDGGPPAFCYVVWGGSSGGVVTEYYVDLLAAEFTTGGSVVIDDVDNWAELRRWVDGELVFRAVCTNGTLTAVSAASLDAGASVTLEDEDPQLYWDYERGIAASGGVASFDGVWSDPASPEFTTAGKTLGAGSAVLASWGTTGAGLVLDDYAYAQCRDLGD